MGSKTTNQIDIKTTTAVVDQGRAAADKTGYKSAQRSQNPERVQDAMVLRIPGGAGNADGAISDIKRNYPAPGPATIFSEFKCPIIIRKIFDILYVVRHPGV